MGFNTPLVIFGKNMGEIPELFYFGEMIFDKTIPPDIGWSGKSEHADMASVFVTYQNSVFPLSCWFCPFGLEIEKLSKTGTISKKTVVFNVLNDAYGAIVKEGNLYENIRKAIFFKEECVPIDSWANPITTIGVVDYDAIGFFMTTKNHGKFLGEVDWVKKCDRGAWFQALVDIEPVKRASISKNDTAYNLKKFILWAINSTEELLRFRKFDRNMQKRRKKC